MAAKNVTKQVSCHQLEQKTKLANELQINEKKVRINKLVLKGNLAEKRLTDKKILQTPQSVHSDRKYWLEMSKTISFNFTIYNLQSFVFTWNVCNSVLEEEPISNPGAIYV